MYFKGINKDTVVPATEKSHQTKVQKKTEKKLTKQCDN